MATQLLVSVQNVDEASLALELGVGWIDLKNPSSGSLGAPEVAVANAVSEVLRGTRKKSIALGELNDVHRESVNELVGIESAQGYPIAKVGLSNLRQSVGWQDKFSALSAALGGTQLVPVLYADGVRCAAVSAAAVLEVAQSTAAPYLLVDTFQKDGSRLLDWMTFEDLELLTEQARGIGLRLVLAGSLQSADVPCLLKLQPAALAVRGAVCFGARTGVLSAERVRQWVEMLAAEARSSIS